MEILHSDSNGLLFMLFRLCQLGFKLFNPAFVVVFNLVTVIFELRVKLHYCVILFLEKLLDEGFLGLKFFLS